MKTKSLLNRRVQLSFAAAILTLLAAGAISFRSVAVTIESEEWIPHTRQVLEALQDLRSAIRAVESSYRGFALTGNELDLRSYRAGIVTAHQALAMVHSLTADNSEQQLQIPTLQALAAQEIRFGETVIRLRQTLGLQAAAHAVQSARGETGMAEFEREVREMQDRESRLLALRNEVARRGLSRTKSIVSLATIMGLLITVAAAWSIQRDNASRALAAETVRESEEKYQLLLDEIQDHAIFLLDPLGLVLTWNAGAQRIKGYTAGQILGRNFSCFFTPEDVSLGKPEAILRMTIKNGRHEEQGIRVRKDGSRFLASVIFTALRDSTGRLRGFSEFSHDLTQAQQSDVRYRGLLEAAPDAMVVVNARGQIVLLNVQAEKRFGYRRDELVGQKVTNIIPEGFAERLIADDTRSAAEALAQQIGAGIELSGRRKDGSEFPIEIMLSPLESAEGILVTAAIRDISVRKDAERYLSQMEGRYRGLLEAAPDAMVVVNARGEIVLLNVQAEKRFGYRRDELVGQKVTNIIPEGFAERLIADGTRTAAEALAQQIGAGIELSGRRKDGSEFPIEIMLSPLESAEGILVTAAIRDITERKKSEQHLVQTVEELKRSNEELEKFASFASHDLQEPLRMVASYTQLLAKRYKGQLGPDADEFIAYAVNGTYRMQSLIQDLLAYSRAGSAARPLQQISSEHALDTALTNLRATTEESAVIITHDSLPDLTTDEAQLTQVFQNLVGNAVKYRNGDKPSVHVSAYMDGGGDWIFSVRDNGLGIDPQYFEKIFVLFQRLHGQKDFKGTGIGLAICKKIVERLGGRIWLESQPGVGSTFYFALPQGNAK